MMKPGAEEWGVDPSTLPLVPSGGARGLGQVKIGGSASARRAARADLPGNGQEAIVADRSATLAPVAAAADTRTPPNGPDSVPLKPSVGAIQGALGAVLPLARACLAAATPARHAMVTFQSDGSVEGVEISGAVAGTPAEACIRTSLGAARVPPFAQKTFSAPVTVRPN
jgi:hypothetical protein